MGGNGGYQPPHEKPTGLILTIVQTAEQALTQECKDGPYTRFSKTSQVDLTAYEPIRQGNQSWYTDKEGYRAVSGTSEHGPWAPPQWAPYIPNAHCKSGGDWRHQRCNESMARMVYRTCEGLHLTRGCPHSAVSTR